MAPVRSGAYRIGLPHEQQLTLEGGSPRPGMPALILPPTGRPGEQEWEVQSTDSGNYTVRNLGSRSYLSFDGEPRPMMQVCGSPQPCEWQIAPGEKPDTFTLGVPGTELILGQSMLRIYPPRVALVEAHGEEHEAWTFRTLDD